MANFALIGAGGYIAPRHLQAIQDTGNRLVAAVDKNDSVGVLDRYFPQTHFFTEIERFDRHLEKLRRQPDSAAVDYVSVCTPNYLHDSHIRLALRVGAHAICEKPLVVNPWNLDALQEIESETGRRVHTVLQLRLHPSIIALREKLRALPARQADVSLTYVTRRGPWYQMSWKGSEEKSGGLAMNIGVHFFDLLLWLFGPVTGSSVYLRNSRRVSGTLNLERARVRWYLSIAEEDLPRGHIEAGKPAFRSLQVDGEEVEFSEGFGDLHTKTYEAILAGNGFGLEDARPSLNLIHQVRHCELEPVDSQSGHDTLHPHLEALTMGSRLEYSVEK